MMYNVQLYNMVVSAGLVHVLLLLVSEMLDERDSFEIVQNFKYKN